MIINKTFDKFMDSSFRRNISEKKKVKSGVPVVAQWLTNPTSIHEDTGSVLDLAQWVRDLVLL